MCICSRFILLIVLLRGSAKMAILHRRLHEVQVDSRPTHSLEVLGTRVILSPNLYEAQPNISATFLLQN